MALPAQRRPARRQRAKTPVAQATAYVADDAADSAGVAAEAAQTAIDTHEALATAAHAASAIAFTPVGTIGSSDVQAAIVEVEGDAAAASGSAATALANAATAEADAQTGIANAAAAQATANTAVTNAAAAQTTANTGVTNAAAAQTTANTAVTNAATAQSTANAHHARHEPGGADAMAVDAVAATGSLRTLGTGAQQAAAGNDGRFTDARAPTAHASTHASGGSDAVTLAQSQITGLVAALAAKADAVRQIATGTGLTGGGDLSADRTLSLATIADQRFMANVSGGSAAPTAITAAQAKTLLAIAAGDVSGLATVATSGSASDLGSGTLPAGRLPALTGGDVTSSAGSATLTIAAAAVTLAKMANLAANSIIGNNTSSPATPLALTVAQVKTLLSLVPGTDVQAYSSILAGIAGSTGPTSSTLNWTIQGATTPGTHTYAIRNGFYIQFGKIIFFWGRAQISVKNSSGSAMAGVIQIAGLPSASVNVANHMTAGQVTGLDNVAFGGFLSLYIPVNSSLISFHKNTTGTATTSADLTAADLGANPNFIISGAYEAA